MSISTYIKSTKEIIKRQVIDNDIILTLPNGLNILVDRKEYNLYSLQAKIKKVC